MKRKPRPKCINIYLNTILFWSATNFNFANSYRCRFSRHYKKMKKKMITYFLLRKQHNKNLNKIINNPSLV